LDRLDTPGNASQTYAYADGVDEAVVMNSTGGSYPYGNGMYALITDHLGSVVAIADNTGRLVETYEYTPFGKTTIRNRYGQTISTSDAGNVLGFTGREMDGGLYYLRNRWYSPDLGRFLEPDPIGLRGGDVNIYRYVRNNPLWWVDPFGLADPGDVDSPSKVPPASPPPAPSPGSSCSVGASGDFTTTPAPTTPGKVIPSITVTTPGITGSGSVTISLPGGPTAVGAGVTLTPIKGFGTGWDLKAGVTVSTKPGGPTEYDISIGRKF
jgi:RHS repeat-associated protein